MPEPFRIALITGANKGIGLATARRLGQAGLRVLIGARKPALGEAAATMLASEGLDTRFIHIDLNAPETLIAAASAIETEFGRLDVLVNNAGITDRADGSPGRASPEAVRRIFDTNVHGSLAVTQAMLPLLRRSSSGRIVNVSSGLGSISLNSDPDWEFATRRRAARHRNQGQFRRSGIYGDRPQRPSRISKHRRGGRDRGSLGSTAWRRSYRRVFQPGRRLPLVKFLLRLERYWFACLRELRTENGWKASKESKPIQYSPRHSWAILYLEQHVVMKIQYLVESPRPQVIDPSVNVNPTYPAHIG